MTSPDDTATPRDPDAFKQALDGHADAARKALELGLLRGWSRAVARDAGTGHAGSAVEWTEDDHDAA